MKSFNIYIYIIFVISSFYVPSTIYGQVQNKTVVKGKIIDENSKEPISFASIIFENSKTGTYSDIDGNFILEDSVKSQKIIISSIDYNTVEFEIVVGKTQNVTIKMNTKTVNLNEIIVKSKRKRYKNKNNQAVDIIKNVIKNKDINKKENLDFLSYEKYDKTQFALSNLSEKFMNRKSLKKFDFIFENIDTIKLEGSKILPIYMKETLSKSYYQKNPQKTKEIISADKMVSFDGYVNNQGMTEYLNYMYQHIDIYENNITFVTNVFLSPIANSAPTFYLYFIQDTLKIDGDECIKLYFSPRNKEDMLFNGFIYITNDSSYAVKKIEMSVNKKINQNWVKDVKIIQEFEQTENKVWLLKYDDISIDFGISENSMGIFGQRTVLYSDFNINNTIPDSVFAGPAVIQLSDANEKNKDYWNTYRPIDLSVSEKGIYTITDSIKQIPAFKRTMDVLFLLLVGYKDFGKFEIGPLNTFYSYNPIEGARLRFGGRTTPEFSKKINFETYLAYGFVDNKFKYYFATTYSLTQNSIYHFPVKSLKLSFQNETSIPGQELQFIQEDNVLLSIKRGVNDKMFYNKTIKFEHYNEYQNHFSYTFGYSFNTIIPEGSLKFNTVNADFIIEDEQSLNISEIYLNFRYAPHEKFYQGKQYRTPMTNKYPIINIYYNLGLKAFGNNYDYQNIKINIYKRFYPGVFGYTDVIFEAGKIFGEVSYPLLFMHRANQTYAYQLASYNLMNFLEFVSDEYISLNIDHHFNGFIFNKIPLIKKLKFREVASAKILYGNLTNQNNPEKNTYLFKFPTDDLGNPITFSLIDGPYVEVSVGVENVLKFFRIDVVKRLTYTNNPKVSEIGIRARFRFDF